MAKDDTDNSAIDLLDLDNAPMLPVQNTNAVQLARELGYDGALTVGAIEDRLSFYQHRTVEDCLEMGKCLLLLKEITPFGEFKQRIELKTISYRMAAKFMSATLKFAKVNSSSLLKSAGTQTKMLELLILDDDDLAALADGETVNGLQLDDVERMSCRELKKALRESREVAKSKDSLIKRKDEKLNELDQKLDRLKDQPTVTMVPPADMLGEKEMHSLQDCTLRITARITTELRRDLGELYDAFSYQPPREVMLFAAQQFGLIITTAYSLADSFHLQPADNPNTATQDPARVDAGVVDSLMPVNADSDNSIDGEVL